MIKDKIKNLLLYSMPEIAMDFLLNHFKNCESPNKNKSTELLSKTIYEKYTALEELISNKEITYIEFKLEQLKLVDAFLKILKKFPCKNCGVDRKVNELKLSDKEKEIIKTYIDLNDLH